MRTKSRGRRRQRGVAAKRHGHSQEQCEEGSHGAEAVTRIVTDVTERIAAMQARRQVVTLEEERVHGGT